MAHKNEDRTADKIKDTDSFWDIDLMMPEKRIKKRFSSDTDTVRVDFGGGEGEGGEVVPRPKKDGVQEGRLDTARRALQLAEARLKTASTLPSADRHLINKEDIEASVADRADCDTPLYSYVPKRNTLIKSVAVKPWQISYTVYGRFRPNAKKYLNKEPFPCPFVPFFSYAPQYSQLTPEQLSFYVYWRSLINEGKYEKTDYSYILLYIYEIINLPDVIPYEEGAKRLCLIWRNYRKKYKRLDLIIPEWLCDYCLLGQIDPPTELFSDFFTLPSSSMFLREYYSGYDGGSSSPYASVLFACASSYNYKSSKFITPENSALFDKHIKGAFVYAFSKAEKENITVFAPLGKNATVTANTVRDAFSGAVCAYDIKRRIEVSYLSCSRSVELRFAVTDMVKYCENGVRALLGIRSRFHTPNLAQPLKSFADEYFAPYKKKLKKEPAPPPAPEYERLYEPSSSGLSIDRAKELEKSSWATTELLVKDLEDGEGDSISLSTDGAARKNGAPDPEAASSIEYAGTPPHILRAISALLKDDKAEFISVARERNLLPDTLCEEINALLFDIFYDTVIYSDGDDIGIIPDYREDMTEWMKK